MQARTLGVEAAATGQGAGVAARWPPLIVGLKIESVHELGCLSSAQAKRIVSKMICYTANISTTFNNLSYIPSYICYLSYYL